MLVTKLTVNQWAHACCLQSAHYLSEGEARKEAALQRHQSMPLITLSSKTKSLYSLLVRLEHYTGLLLKGDVKAKKTYMLEEKCMLSYLCGK